MKVVGYASILVILTTVLTLGVLRFRYGLVTCHKFKIVELHKRLYSMMGIVDTYLQKYDVPYIAQYGTLLGLIRDNGIIAHDDDLDVDVFKDGEEDLKNAMKELVNESGGKYKFFEFPMFGYKLVETEHWSKELPECGIQLDFFIRSRTGEGIYSLCNRACGIWPRECTIESSDIFPIRRGMLGRVEVSIPNKPENILTKMFGDDWRVPKKTHSHSRTDD
jgi:hypothetical protein